MSKKNSLAHSFYLSNNVVNMSKLLLGKILETHIDNQITSGIIVETEAYAGENDKAAHSYRNKKTHRNQAMFKLGGIAYVYRCYGIHNLFNLVTNQVNKPQGILIRAIKPVCGINYMLKRRKMSKISYNLTSGPGKLSQALGITSAHNMLSLEGPEIFIKDTKERILSKNIISSPRIGVEYAGKDALKLWRFRIKKNPWCSQQGKNNL